MKPADALISFLTRAVLKQSMLNSDGGFNPRQKTVLFLSKLHHYSPKLQINF